MTRRCSLRQPARAPLVLALALAGLLPWSQPVQAAPRADVDVVGSLGASATGVSSSSIKALSARSQMAGYSDLYTNGVNMGSRAFVWRNGVMTNLGILGANSSGYGSSIATGINADGQVVGNSTYYVNGAEAGQRAFVWRNGVMTNLGSLGVNASGVGNSAAVAINAGGQVVGNSNYFVNGADMGSRAFVWRDGVMTNLGMLGTSTTGVGSSTAVAINASGLVAGNSDDYTTGAYKGSRAFIWRDGVMTSLGSLGTNSFGNGSSAAVALNAGGQVAGNSLYYVNGVNKGQRAFVWQNGVMTNLGSFGGDSTGMGSSLVAGLNDSGQVAGTSSLYVNGVNKGQRAFVWSNGVMTNLGTLGADSSGNASSTAWAINASGQVVGLSAVYANGANLGNRAFLYNDGKMFRLDTFAPSGWVWNIASGINDFGQVVVHGNNKGKTVPGLFTPHPDWQGGSGSWADAKRWNYAGMGAFGFTPGAPHKVNIETTAATTVTGPANALVQSLSVGSTVAKGATLDLNGGVLRTAGGTVLNSGGVLTGSGQMLGGLQTKAGSELNVASGQSLQVDKAEFADKVHNDGELTIDASATFTAGTYSGAGALKGSGVLTFGSGSVFAPGNSPALVKVDVQTTLGTGSLLQMELGGTVAGAGHDKLVFGKSVTLGGDLDVVWLGGFAGHVGQVFDLFDWNGGVSGSFANLALPTLASGLRWDTSDLYNGGNLRVASLTTAVPEPETYLLALAGVLVLGWARRGRANP